MVDDTALEELPTAEVADAADAPEATPEPSPASKPGSSPGSSPGSIGGGKRVLAMWLPTPSRRRIIDADLEIVDDLADGPELILVSTRGPAARRASIRSMAETAPVIAVCHPGGEPVAAELVSYGAIAVISEGSESSALRVLEGEPSTHLVDAYIGEVDKSWNGGSTTSIDPITGLATGSAFELRLAELGKDGAMPRLGLIDLGLADSVRVVGPAGASVIRRRLAVTISGATVQRGTELFDLGANLAMLSPSLPVEQAISLGREILEMGTAYRPSGEPLEIAVGWAGPEAAADPAGLRLLAERALETARTRELRVVDAEELSQHSAASVELAAAMKTADAVDLLDPRGAHSVRVSDYAADLARELQMESIEIAEVGLAARLHDVGKLFFGAAAFDPSSEQHEQASKEHPERGAKFVISTAGQRVASMIRTHHEKWDGTGFPEGISGQEIPMGTRILAVAHKYDELVIEGLSPREIEDRLRDEAGVTLDPELVEAAILLFGRG